MENLPSTQHPLEAVRGLEAALMQLPQIDLNTKHVVFGKMCARTIYIPAGVALTGALTRCDNICVVSGDIIVTTDEGSKRLSGFNVIPAKAGAKRAGYAIADTYWTTIWFTELTDIRAIEDEMTEESGMLQTRNLLPTSDHELLEEF